MRPLPALRNLSVLLFFSAACSVAWFATRLPRAAAEDRSAERVLRDGWWIRVNTSRTEATSIDFQIGTKAQDRETWRTWHSGDPIEFDVPMKYRTVDHIYLRATANPEGRHAWFCLMYGGKGVKHFDTDNWEQEDRAQNDTDDECK